MHDNTDGIAADFKDIFATREEADKLLDLFANACAALGVTAANDPMIALTWFKTGSRRRMRLNYGNVVALGIEGKRGRLSEVFLLVNKASWEEHPRLEISPDEMRGVAAGYSFATATWSDAAAVLPEIPELVGHYFPPFVELFSDWKRSPYRRYHNPMLMEAVLDRDKRAALLSGGFQALGAPSSASSIGRRAFELLGVLEDTPYKSTYEQHKEEFIRELEDPFKRLFARVTEGLPDAVVDAMELSKNVTSRIPKNDYGRGGAHSHYWGAIYPRDGRRISDAQLFVTIDSQRMRTGFSIGHFAGKSHERHLQNATRYARQLARMFESGVEDLGWFSRDTDSDSAPVDWHDYFADPVKFETTVAVELDRDTFLQRTDEELVETIRDVWTQLYPLVLLTTSEDPVDQIKDYLLLRDGEEPTDALEPYPRYTATDFAEETGFAEETVSLWRAALERKGQVVLYGPPGTGKTFVAERLARVLLSEKQGTLATVQFHPAYTYEEFMEGIRPERHVSGGLDYPTKNGRFVDFCIQAERLGPDAPAVFIVDEINRAHLARVFGELMYLLEYRDKRIALPSGQLFRIPENVFIIGTMNTADRSIALVDHALRRRFAFLRIDPNFEVLRVFHDKRGQDVTGLIDVLENINRAIGDPNYFVGISFFMHDNLESQLRIIWDTEILPYLEEYFFDQPEAVDRFRWDAVAERIMPHGA